MGIIINHDKDPYSTTIHFASVLLIENKQTSHLLRLRWDSDAVHVDLAHQAMFPFQIKLSHKIHVWYIYVPIFATKNQNMNQR